jgi:periplasmic protein TonB
MRNAGIAVVVSCLLAGCVGRTFDVPVASAGTQHSRPARLRVSQGVMEQSLIHYVKPVYSGDPQKQGDVTVLFWVDKSGAVGNVRAIDGDPMLARAAVEAVKQWKYHPYLLNGEPVDVETVAVVSVGK